MRGQEAREWLEGYLYRSPGYQATENSVFELGERAGLSIYALRQAARAVGVVIVAGFWELPEQRIEGLEVRAILELDKQPEPPLPPRMPSVVAIDPTSLRARRDD